MRKKLVKKIKSGKYALDFDNGNVEQLNDVEYLMDGERFLSGASRFYDSLDNVFGGVDKTDLPTIKLSKIFKPKKVKNNDRVEWITWLKRNGSEVSVKYHGSYKITKYKGIDKPIIEECSPKK